MRTGIYGGSFNPVHRGHIHLAETAMKDFMLDRIYLVPSRISPHRSSDEYVSPEDRLAMLKIATSHNENLLISDYELKNDRISYSVYTIRHFRQKHPGDELFLLVGSDMLLSFESWFCYEEILSTASLAVVSRMKDDYDILKNKAKTLSAHGNILISHAPPEVISSTEIRKNLYKNPDYACYLDENVVQYIRLKRLYSGDN